MIELIILVLVLYIAMKLAWWLIKTTIFIGLAAFIGAFFWIFFLV